MGGALGLGEEDTETHLKKRENKTYSIEFDK